jgi:hypothetical protein
MINNMMFVVQRRQITFVDEKSSQDCFDLHR